MNAISGLVCGRPLTDLASHLDREEDFRNTLKSVWKTGRTAPHQTMTVRL